ncbi:MAG: hypothetical protein U0414_05640 [Polyangiaceae bacterium]
MYVRRVGNPPERGERPRLSPRVLPRRYLDGNERIALHAGGRVLVLDEASFRVARCLDGTRDVEGVRLAALGSGVACTSEDVERILATLSDAGMLEQGVDLATPDEAPAPVADREVVALPDYAFECDGSGGCCSQYPSIGLDAADARRALAAGMRLLPDDRDGERTLMPFDASRGTRRLAMALVEGRCLQLDEDGKCAIHRAAGEAAKPRGCRLYPLTFLDDGEKVRVSVGFECSCVFTSATRARPGDVLTSARRTAELPEGARVRALPELLSIAGRAGARREVLAAWLDAFSRGAGGGDAIRALLDAAGRLVSEAGDAAGEVPSLESMLASYAAGFAAADESSQAWRSARDRIRCMRTVVREAAARAQPATAPSDEAAEAFYLRASLFGLDYLGPAPVVHALIGAAARLVIARHVGGELGHPIAVVEATARGLSPAG